MMSRKTATYLCRKALKSIQNLDPPSIYLFDTALEMFKHVWPDDYNDKINYYSQYIKSNKYQSASRGGSYYKDYYNQPSMRGKSNVFGLATRPCISVTTEGQPYKEFTFTIFHEVAHIIYDTQDEIVANSFALLYNERLWSKRNNIYGN